MNPHLAGIKTAVPDDDVLFPFNRDSRSHGAVGRHAELNAVHGVIGSKQQNVLAAVAGE